MTKLVLLAFALTVSACATTPPPPAPVTACGAGGEVVNFPPGAVPGFAGKMPVNVGLGSNACPKP